LNQYFIILFFLFTFAFVGASILLIVVVLKAQTITSRNDMLFFLAGIILIVIAGIGILLASALGLIVSPEIVMPVTISILTGGFLFITYSCQFGN